MKCPKCGHWSLFEFIYCKKCGLNLMRPNDNAETHSEEVSSSFSKKNIVITDYSNTTNELAKIGKTAQTVKAFKWEKRQPNPKSKNVEISTDGVEFSCPTCGKSNYCNYDNINSESGVMIECNHCNNISHVPGDYKSKNKLSELSIYGCVLLSIDDFSEWYWSHPCICNSSYGPEYYGSYGLWAFCADCKYKYASTVLPSFPLSEQAKGFIFNANSKKSADDFNGLTNRSCPSCGYSNLLSLMIPIPERIIKIIDERIK